MRSKIRESTLKSIRKIGRLSTLRMKGKCSRRAHALYHAAKCNAHLTLDILKQRKMGPFDALGGIIYASAATHAFYQAEMHEGRDPTLAGIAP